MFLIGAGTKDAEDLAEESLPAEPTMKEVINEPAQSPVSNPACTAPYDTDERASSPLTDDVYTRGIQVMKHKAPVLGLMDIEGPKATRKTLSAGPAAEIEASKALKDLLRFMVNGRRCSQSLIHRLQQPQAMTTITSATPTMAVARRIRWMRSVKEARAARRMVRSSSVRRNI